MICLQFDRMLTLRNVVILLVLEVSFSLVIANNSNTRPKTNKPRAIRTTTTRPKRCPINAIANGEPFIEGKKGWQPVRTRQIAVDRSIRYVCNEGHQVNGNDILTCKENGKWSHRVPVCVAIPRTAATEEVHTPGIPSTTTYLQPTQKSTTIAKSVKTITSGSPAVDEGLTTSPDELPWGATVEKAKTSEAFRVITITVPTRTSPLPMSTRVASSSVESHQPQSTTTTAGLLQSVDAGDLKSYPTLKAEESTVVVPSSTPVFSSFPDNVMESDTTASNNLDRIARSSTGELTEAQSTSEMFYQDEETKGPDTRVTETHQLFPETTGEYLEEKVSTNDAYETTSQKPFETEESVVSSAETVSETEEEEDDTTPETRDLTSANDPGLKTSEDDDAEIQSPTLESVSHYTVSHELLTVQSKSSRIQVPINEVEIGTTAEESLSSFTVESEDTNLPLGHDFTETDSKSQRSLIVTHFPTKSPSESSSEDEAIVLKPETMPTIENKTGKARLRSHSILTTHASPSNPSGYKSTSVSAPTIDSAAMTNGNSASIILIVIIVAAVIILVVLLFILGKALLPKCTLLQKPCQEQGAVPYTAQNNQPDQVVLKGICPTTENDICTQV